MESTRLARERAARIPFAASRKYLQARLLMRRARLWLHVFPVSFPGFPWSVRLEQSVRMKKQMSRRERCFLRGLKDLPA